VVAVGTSVASAVGVVSGEQEERKKINIRVKPTILDFI